MDATPFTRYRPKDLNFHANKGYVSRAALDSDLGFDDIRDSKGLACYCTKSSKAITGFTHPLLQFGDCDSSCHVERANVRVVTELATKNDWLHKYVWPVSGGYGSEALFFAMKLPTELADLINSLDDYPCLSDDVASEVEHELIDAAWISCYESDFRSELLEKLEAMGISESFQDRVENLDCLRTFFEDLREQANTYWEIEAGGNAYVRIERVIAQLDKPWTVYKHTDSGIQSKGLTITENLLHRLIFPDDFAADPRQLNLFELA